MADNDDDDLDAFFDDVENAVKEVQEEEADEVDEPELRKEESAPPAAKKSDLASVVADWDTDD